MAVSAISSIQARIAKTFIVRCVAISSNPTSFTVTLITTKRILFTYPLILARIKEAFSDVSFALRASESNRTIAIETVHLIDACTAMVTRIAVAFINVQLTKTTSETSRTVACKVANTVNTCGPIGTRVRVAFVDIDFAGPPSITHGTCATNCID
jgi:hypothetical protein